MYKDKHDFRNWEFIQTVIMMVDIFMSLFLVLLLVVSNSYQDFQPRSFANEKAGNLPDGYTLQANISISLRVGVVLLSPDQKWIVYTRHIQSSGPKNMLHVKSRNPSSKPLPIFYSSDYGQYIGQCQKCIQFNEKGDLLFFATNRGILYMCNFSADVTKSNCQTIKDLNTTSDRSIHCIDVNKQNQVSLVWNSPDYFTICIVGLEEGKLVLKGSYPSQRDKVNYWIAWHPIDQEMLISLQLFSRSNLQFGTTFMSINVINTTTTGGNNTFTMDGSFDGKFKLDISNDGRILFVSTSNGIYPFIYFYGWFSIIGEIYDIAYSTIKISTDERLLIAYRSEKSQIELLEIQKNIPQSKFSKANIFFQSTIQQARISPLQTQHYRTSSISVSLQYLTKLSSVAQNIFCSSADNNLIIIFSSDSLTLSFYTLCPNQTYLYNADCLQCSNNCSSCHFNQTICTTCPNNSYILENSVCFPCFKYMSNCSTCQNQSACLKCYDFYYLTQNKCKACDIQGACKSCTSDTNCTLCDSNKGFNETSTNGTCQCLQNFSTVNQTCIQCSIKGCIKCQQTNKCSSCIEQDYDLSPDGKCVKKENRSNSDNNIYIFIGSGLGGVVLIGIIIGVYCKCKQKKNKADKLIGQGQGTQSKRSQIERSIIDQRALRSIVQQRVDEHAIRDQRQKVKYSDEERMRLKRLQDSSLISN